MAASGNNLPLLIAGLIGGYFALSAYEQSRFDSQSGEETRHHLSLRDRVDRKALRERLEAIGALDDRKTAGSGSADVSGPR